MRIGLDTGATFTDLVLLDNKQVRLRKVRSTPHDPSRAILTGIRELVGADDVVYGTTVATTVVLEGRGGRVVLVATAGFEDVLRIGRQTRRERHNFLVENRRSQVEDGLIVRIRERLAYDGSVIEPLLLLQGATDDGVAAIQRLDLLESLTRAGKRARYIEYTGEGHGFRQAGSVHALYQRVERFFGEHNGQSARATP